MIAIITARGGSKRLPRKNLHLLNGKPLLFYTVKAAFDCPMIAATFVTTDDDEIAEAARGFGAKVIARPADLATDKASSEVAVRHALDEIAQAGVDTETFCLLQPTSPLRNATHLTGAIDAFFAAGSQPALSVSRAPAHFNKLMRLENDALRPYFDLGFFKLPGGALQELYLPNGAIYILRTRDFLDRNSFYAHQMTPFVMADEVSIDIDTLQDLRFAELQLQFQSAGSP